MPDAVIDAACAIRPESSAARSPATGTSPQPARPLGVGPSGIVRAWLASGPQSLPPTEAPATAGRHPRDPPDGPGRGRGRQAHREGDHRGARIRPGRCLLSFFRSIAGHEHPELRIVATWRWQSLDAGAAGGAAATDADPGVREAAPRTGTGRWTRNRWRPRCSPSAGATGFVFGACALSPALVEQCFADGTVPLTAQNPHTPGYALARLARHPDAEVRTASVAVRGPT